MPVVYKELNGYPKHHKTREGFMATRKVICTWANAGEVEDWFLSQNNGLGELYPYKTAAKAYAFDTSLEPLPQSLMGEAGNLASYGDATVTVQYRTPRIQDPREITLPDGGTAIVSQHLETAGEHIILPFEKFRWGAGSGPGSLEILPGEAPAKTLHSLVYVFTKYNVTHVPAAVWALEGRVNQNPLRAELLGPGEGHSFAAETILLTSISQELGVPSGGSLTGSVTYRFAIRENGWNKFWKPDGSDGEGFYEMYVKDAPSPYKNYPLGIFTVL